MSSLPSYQPRRLPEGRYRFTIKKEPDKVWRGSEPNRFIAVTFFLKAEAPDGSVRDHTESVLPFDEKYRDILFALGGLEDEAGEVHIGEMVDIVGKSFVAHIRHEPDKNDSSKSWARIVDVEVKKEASKDEDVPPPASTVDEDDPEVPF